MKILIIEDEQRTADQIIRLIKQYDSSYSIMEVLDSVEKGVEWFTTRTESPDILLADIQLTDGTSFDLFSQLNIEIPVIFITAYNEFALNAFRLNSIDYLLKPLDFADLKIAFDKFIKTRESYVKTSFKEYCHLLAPAKKQYKKRFLVKSGNSFKYILTDDVACFKAEDGLVFAFLSSGGKSIIENSLTDLSYLLDPDYFFQINRKTIVNLTSINKISNYFNRRLLIQILPDNHEDIVSRERAQDFKEWLNR